MPEQCLYTPSSEQLDETVGTFLSGPASPLGNSPDWDPPGSVLEILFRMDATKGCGDLIFSSHIMMSLMCVLTTYYYFPSICLRIVMTLLLAVMVPFTLASRKHYTIDVFTSLYVVPMFYELMWLKYPDTDSKSEMLSKYGIDYRHDASSQQFFADMK